MVLDNLLPTTMELRFVTNRTSVSLQDVGNALGADIRAHASRMGYRNARLAKSKKHDTIDRPAKASSNREASPLSQAKAHSMQTQFRVVLKEKRSPYSRFIIEHGGPAKKKAKPSNALHLAKVKPALLLSADLNCPRYIDMWAHQLFPNTEAFHECLNVYSVSALPHIRPYLDDDVFQQTIAAVTYVFHQARAGARKLGSKDIFWHRGQALKVLRQRLDDPHIDSAIILSVLFFIILEGVLGHLEVSQMHKCMLRRLIHRKGGLEALEEHVIAAILQQNQYWLDAGLDPILPRQTRPSTFVLDYPTIPLLPGVRNMVDHLPKGFKTLAMQGEISTQPLDVLLRITHLHLSTRQQIPSMTTLRYPYPPVLGASPRNRTYSDAFPVLEMPDREEIIFQKLLCLTLLVYSLLYLGNASAVSNMPLNARAELTRRLSSVENKTLDVHKSCLFWMWRIAVQSWRLPNGQLDQPGHDLEQARPATFEQIYAEGQTKHVLEDFVWRESELNDLSDLT